MWTSSVKLRMAGAESVPQAKLHLKLADEELQQARLLIGNKHNDEAALVLDRAKADAELAIGLARQAKAETQAKEASARVSALRANPQ
jgi:hypothetical protein